MLRTSMSNTPLLDTVRFPIASRSAFQSHTPAFLISNSSRRLLRYFNVSTPILFIRRMPELSIRTRIGSDELPQLS